MWKIGGRGLLSLGLLFWSCACFLSECNRLVSPTMLESTSKPNYSISASRALSSGRLLLVKLTLFNRAYVSECFLWPQPASCASRQGSWAAGQLALFDSLSNGNNVASAAQV